MSIIKSIFFDLDGVLYIGNQPVVGAHETISFLRSQEYILRFITNTSTKLTDEIIENLSQLGIKVFREELFTPLSVSLDYMRSREFDSFFPLLNKKLHNFYTEFQICDKNPDCILIGDIGDKWNYELMNKIFNFVMSGSELLALHKGKFYKSENGNVIDIGAFVTGIEYATNVKAKIFGKPDRNFFNTVINSTGVSPESILMVGDDIDNDIKGAKDSGMNAVLTRTGKYDEKFVSSHDIKPDLIIDSINVLPKILKEMK